MSSTSGLAESGVGGRLNWLLGGALGGIVGAILFGGVLWAVDPTIVTESIPQVYGLDGGDVVGWVFHLAHGLVLGTVFGFIITRDVVLGTITADVETPVLDAMGPSARIVFAGLVYGLAVWVLLPGVLLSILVSVGGVTDPFPIASVYNLLGHMLYGMLLGALVSVFVDLSRDVRDAEAPFEEATESSQEHRG